MMFFTIINHFEDLTRSFSSISGNDGMLSFFVLLFALLIPIFTDTFAYLIGGIFGGKKLAPKISPKKTWSGAIGGVIVCTLLCSAVFFIFNSVPSIATMFSNTGIEIYKIVIIAFIGAILSECGDLFESYLKRSAGVKDSGNIMPGHGGMLDRLDSHFFVAPFIFIAFSIIFLLI
jgi:phosphatidate cytidylyltransferase